MAEHDEYKRTGFVENVLIDVEEDLREPVGRPADNVAHDDDEDHFGDATIGLLARLRHVQLLIALALLIERAQNLRVEDDYQAHGHDVVYSESYI